MASSGNFPTLNPLYRGQRGTSSNYYPIITQGNTRAHSSSNSDALQISTVENLKTGKWYWEWCIQDNNADKLMHSGAADSRRDQWDYAAAAATYGAEQSIHFHTYFQIVEKNGSDTGAYSSSASSHSVDDVFGIALDTDNGKFYVHKNGTYYASGNPATGANPGATWTPATEYTDGFTPYFTASGGGDADGILNFGQDSTFGGAISAGGNADGNGFGDFKYAPPTGFLAVCSANLPISADIDPAQTDDNYPQKQFNTVLYTGTGSSNAITGLGFQPDLVWLKQRGSSGSNMLLDTNRGTNARLSANNTNEERTASSYFTSFDSDGFTVTGNDSISNVSSGTFVGWCWRANGGTTASNSNGSITATVQANTAAGFSIATYTSPGSGTNHTVGHGLSDVDFIITKNRSSAFNWYCFHKSVPDKTYRLNDGGEFSYSNWSMGATTWGSEDGYTHNSTNNFVAYCWQNVEGFPKIWKLHRKWEFRWTICLSWI